MSKENKFLETDSLPPFFDVVDKFLFTFLGIRGEFDSGASGEPWEIYGVEFSVGVQVVKVLVELWNTTAKTMNHDKWDSSLLVDRRSLLRLEHDCVDVRIRTDWYVQLLVGGSKNCSENLKVIIYIS